MSNFAISGHQLFVWPLLPILNSNFCHSVCHCHKLDQTFRNVYLLSVMLSINLQLQAACNESQFHDLHYSEAGAAWVLIACIIVFFMVSEEIKGVMAISK